VLRFRKVDERDDYIPRTVEEWVLNIPTMLDARHGHTLGSLHQDWAEGGNICDALFEGKKVLKGTETGEK
jgi:hypothetical protein